MLKQAWKPGPIPDHGGVVLVSATRFTFSRLRDMPRILYTGMALGRRWHLLEGAIGVSLGADLLRRTTYTISVWQSEADLRGFLTSPEHLRLMRDYRSRVTGSAAAIWTVDGFRLGQAWKEAPARLAEAVRKQGPGKAPA